MEHDINMPGLACLLSTLDTGLKKVLMVLLITSKHSAYFYDCPRQMTHRIFQMTCRHQQARRAFHHNLDIIKTNSWDTHGLIRLTSNACINCWHICIYIQLTHIGYEIMSLQLIRTDIQCQQKQTDGKACSQTYHNVLHH